MTDVNLVIEGANIHGRPVCAPAHRRDGTPNLKCRNGLFLPFFAAFPDLDGPVIRPGHHELDACPARKGPVKSIDDSAMSADFALALACCEVRHAEGMVGRHGIESGREERPLKVQDWGFA